MRAADAPAPARIAATTTGVMVAFATNSLLARGAIGPGAIDPASYTAVRLASGALVLALIARAGGGARSGGSWGGAAALFAYAIAFSYAYVSIGAGVGALVLFGSVQATMIGWGIARGERPRAAEWLGLAVALGGLATLALPGARAPSLPGLGLMALAGAAWGIYSLIGRGSTRPALATAGNFLRSVPMVAVAAAVALPAAGLAATPGGLVLAASAGVASALGYIAWYAVLPALSATRAAIVQLSVPVLAAAAGVVLLAEEVTPRVVVGGAAILGGIALATIRISGSASR